MPAPSSTGWSIPGFVTGTGAARLPDLVRYLRGLEHRLDRLPDRPARDAALLATVHAVCDAYRDVLERCPRPGGTSRRCGRSAG